MPRRKKQKSATEQIRALRPQEKLVIMPRECQRDNLRSTPLAATQLVCGCRTCRPELWCGGPECHGECPYHSPGTLKTPDRVAICPKCLFERAALGHIPFADADRIYYESRWRQSSGAGVGG